MARRKERMAHGRWLIAGSVNPHPPLPLNHGEGWGGRRDTSDEIRDTTYEGREARRSVGPAGIETSARFEGLPEARQRERLFWSDSHHPRSLTAGRASPEPGGSTSSPP